MGKPPGDIDYTIAVDISNDWIRCPCGRALMWIERGQAVLNIKCPSCGKVILLVLGIEIENST